MAGHRDFHSFPTRRSSDLAVVPDCRSEHRASVHRGHQRAGNFWNRAGRLVLEQPLLAAGGLAQRSEEHTSELQSHVNLVCRLLLEKKKNTYEAFNGCWML